MDESEFEGREPEEGRLIAYAHDDGKIYDMSIPVFVTLQTARVLRRQGMSTSDMTSEVISDGTASMALSLIEDGWFTEDEYVTAWAAEEALNLDDELKDVT